LNPERAVLEACLAADSTNLGGVWRQAQITGEDLDAIRAAVSPVQPETYFRKYLAFLRFLLHDDASQIDGHEREAGTQVHRFIARHRAALSRELVIELSARADRALERIESPEARIQARARLANIERIAVPGIYVYALPHYLLHPVSPSGDDVEADRTLLKVGMSDRDTMRRFRQQQRSTELPEDPELLRVYVGDLDTYAVVERQIHELLRAADHRQARGNATGTEWFLTSLKFIDAIAGTLGLRPHDFEAAEG